jgi:Domain of unknown function (DUF4426)
MRILLFLLALVSGSAHAESATNFGDYTVHYQAVPTTELPAAVAQAQGFVRSKNNYLLNVTVLKNDTGTGTAVSANITVTARDLVGKSTTIELKKVDEGSAIYYIGTFRVTHEDQWRFTLNATPEGQEKALVASWEQKFDTL